ncbi:nucleolar and spindle-associated protein 1-like [Argiope bruennichi]|uniref:nucleolar and spindle-associated protein 1-like n=1 Tax=Argiope bruennichi TaxID=94029 RepID=UPI002493DB0F|nr:nucleolar and spindle-associated protein 1-like [Argiope bruennichi]
METPKEEKLRRMSYSELKKHAKEKGIKRNLKSDVLISLILEKAKEDEDSFVALENEIINSCKKNKEAKFEQDKQSESGTPRRETYTLERPTGAVTPVDNDLVVSSASPVLRKTPPTNETSFNVTMSRGSERKMKKRKVSFVTPLRKSTRLSSMTPHFASVKDRPKTPIPSRASSGRKSSLSVKAKISFAETPTEVEVENNSSKISGGRKGKRVSTPMPSSKCKRMNLSSSGLQAPIATPEVSFSEPSQKIPEEITDSDVKKPLKPVLELSATPENKRTATPKSDMKKSVFESSATSGNKRTATPKSDMKKPVKPVFEFSATAGKKITATPKSDIKKAASPYVVNPKSIRTLTPRPNIKKTATPLSANPKNIRIVTPGLRAKKNTPPPSINAKNKRSPRSCVKSATTPSVLSASKVKLPNFKELHQKEFDKMESIDEYQQRKAVNSAKKLKEHLHYRQAVKSSASEKVVSKNKGMKKFGGIPFIPSITSTKDMKLDASSFGVRSVASKKYTTASRNENAAKKKETQVAKKPVKNVSRENTPLKKRFKFDLQASLTKKLTYKPHKGPIKPLAESNANNTSIICPAPIKPVTENKVVEAKRVESRNVLRGVRVNRRFELQMQKRKLASC